LCGHFRPKESRMDKMNKALIVAAGVALAVFVINRFTDSGLANFGKPEKK